MSVQLGRSKTRISFPYWLKEALVLSLGFAAFMTGLSYVYWFTVSVSAFFAAGGLLAVMGASFWFSREIGLLVSGETAGLSDHTLRYGVDVLGMVEGLTEELGLPMPTVVILKTHEKNAMVTGRDPHHTLIGITEGLLKALKHNPEALKAVILHELGHVYHRHSFGRSMYRLLTGWLELLAYRWLSRQEMQVQRRRKSMVALMMDVLGINLFMNLLGLIGLALTRAFEFEADRYATEQGYGVALIQALTILDDTPAYAQAFKDNTYESLIETHLIDSERQAVAPVPNTWWGRITAWMESYSTTTTSARSTFLFSRFLDGMFLHSANWILSWFSTHPEYNHRIDSILRTMELHPQAVKRREAENSDALGASSREAAPIYTPQFCRTGCDLDPEEKLEGVSKACLYKSSL